MLISAAVTWLSNYCDFVLSCVFSFLLPSPSIACNCWQCVATCDLLCDFSFGLNFVLWFARNFRLHVLDLCWIFMIEKFLWFCFAVSVCNLYSSLLRISLQLHDLSILLWGFPSASSNFLHRALARKCENLWRLDFLRKTFGLLLIFCPKLCTKLHFLPFLQLLKMF